MSLTLSSLFEISNWVQRIFMIQTDRECDLGSQAKRKKKMCQESQLKAVGRMAKCLQAAWPLRNHVQGSENTHHQEETPGSKI